MRNLKKFLALVLAMMMTLSLMVTVNASSFSDDTDITPSYQEAIDVLTELGVINGYSDGTFLPKESITRAEVAAIIYRITTGDVSGKNAYRYENADYFTDVLDGKWYNGYVNYCANNGLVLGVGNNRFEPSSPVTGYQALVMILRAMGYNNPQEFSTSDWKFKASGYGSRLGITKNIATGSLSGEATREMVAEIMFQAIQKPTVKYSILNDYTENVLVKAYQDGNGKWVYDKDVYETLLYRTFKIVGKRTILGSDDTYGRPVVEWVKDAKDDTVENGGLYIVNPQKAATTAAATTGDVYGIGGDNAKNKVAEGAVYIPRTTPGATYAAKNDDGDGYKVDADKTDKTAYSYNMRPVYTFNTAMTECDLSKAINNDDQISWDDITEYVNGGKVINRNHVNGGNASAGENFDALHTTNTSGNGGKTSDYTIGAAGRQTEIYNLGDVDKDNNDEWIFVYIDTLLGEVEKVVPHTLDTNGHVVNQAQLWIGVNDYITGDNAVVMTQDDNYTQEKGELVLLTTYGFRQSSMTDKSMQIGFDAGNGTPIDVNYDILDTVPADGTDPDADDFKVATFNTNGTVKAEDAAWAVDFASSTVNENSTVPTATITIDATVGLSEDKNGVMAGGKTYPTTWAYHVDQHTMEADGVTTHEDEFHTKSGLDVIDDTVLADRHVEVTNAIIGQTFTVALDKNGNILGMWQDKSDKIIGVVTDVDYVRVGLGKYAVEMEIFTTDEKTETVRLLDAEHNNAYFPTQEEADDAITTHAETNLAFPEDGMNPKGALVELASYTKDGATYWGVNDKCATFSTFGGVKYYGDYEDSASHSGDGKVEPGKAGTLTGHASWGHETVEVNDETVFIVAEYDFRYNTGDGNQGSNINVRYKVYKGFRNIPVIDASEAVYGTCFNLAFQMLDGKIKDNEAGYVLINAIDPNLKYTQSKMATINPDNSFLVIAPIATYANYSEYLVARNGAEDRIKVANVNNSVNQKLQDAIRDQGLLVATSENSLGYITDVAQVKTVLGATNPNLGGYTDTLIGAGKGLSHSKGVLSWDDSWDTDNHDVDTFTADKFLTTAENCIVKIVNVDLGKMFDATLSAIEQYEADHDIVFELDSNGWVSCLYIID